MGRINPREALGIAVLTVSSLFVATLGALLAWWVLPSAAFPYSWSGMSDGMYGSAWSGWRVTFFLFGAFVAVLGLGLGVTLVQLTYQDWVEYRRRLNAWHAAALEAYTANDGKETERTMVLTDLSPALPLHMLAVALSAHRRVIQGTSSAFSVRALEGPVFLGGVRLGDLSPSAAEQASKNLAALGLIKGRGPRQAGEWVPQSESEVVGLLVDNWKKV
ncbi:MAG: hypothetical protein JO014_22740 [Metakosakonia sp.]|nr:hypothetical protein [Phytobacter sp.]MBV8875531.1 hypothetical protein [Phytobacter sp.]